MATLNPRLFDAPFRGPYGRPVLHRDPAVEAAALETTGSPATAPAVRLVDAETTTLEQVLNELGEREGVRPEQVLVLTCRSSDGRSKNQTRWRLREQQEIGRRGLEWLRARRSQPRIALATIRSSKGLESPVVVLAELDGIGEDTRHDQLLYTAISRAKHQLIVLAPSNALQPKQPGWWERFFKRLSGPQQGKSSQWQPARRAGDNPFIAPEEPDDPSAPLRATIQDSTRIPAPSKEKPASEDRSVTARPTFVAFVPSHFQQDIFDFVSNAHGDGIVRAVAGSGKTSTLVMAARPLHTRNVLFLAFNKHIAQELGQRLHGTPMSARTIHSVGYGTLSRYLGTLELRIVPVKYAKLSRAWVKDNLAHLEREEQQQTTMALNALTDFTRVTPTDPSNSEAMRSLAAHFSVDRDAIDAGEALHLLIQAVPHLLAEGEKIARGDEQARHMIDYTDMIFLPHVWRLPARWHADWVFVDEAQDLNAAQLDLALKCRARGGRMLFVGDPRQAIYGFSGADSVAFDRIKQTTQARELPLSICYRCPTSHIALARELVPEIEPKPGAEPGIVADVERSQLPKLVRKGDLIVSRKTAPLVELCITLMRYRIITHVKGRDIGTRLTQVVQEVAHISGYTWAMFGHFLEEYEHRQGEKIRQFENSEAELVALNDRVAAVRVCYEMFEAKDAADLCRKVDEIFNDGQPYVTLSTIHRTKGLEADRVFLLNPDDMPLRWPNQQEWELEQEHNIKYVALTRAKKDLFRVHGPTTAEPLPTRVGLPSISP